ncbi:MAG: OmpA family protein [Candidatus Marinimicrobia bacterium]|nr:OmpA family protein [Candidatus Neomarinimicrobiota bacterium]
MIQKQRILQLALGMTLVYTSVLFMSCTKTVPAVPLTPQEATLKATLFSEANTAWHAAQRVDAKVLAPGNFAKGVKHYQQAQADLKNEVELEDLQKNLGNAAAYFNRAIRASKLAQVTFPNAIKARNDAKFTESGKYTPKLWAEAESKFNKATGILEDGKVDDARKVGKEAETLYRKAELDAIKVYYLTETRDLLKRADELKVMDNAPKTLALARKLFKQADVELNTNRYDIDFARSLVLQSRHEAQHAIYLASTIKALKEKDHTWEDLILASEVPLQRIAEQTGHVASFEAGYNPPANKIILYITTYQDSVTGLSQDIEWYKTEALFQKERTAELVASLDDQVKLKSEIASKIAAQVKTQDSVAILSQDIKWFKDQRQLEKKRTADLVGMLDNQVKLKSDLASKIAAHAKTQELFTSMEASFTGGEARVLREGDDIIIRLVGLDFPSGEATIEQKSFGLLTKVRDAINTLGSSTITVAGYTDSYGNDDENLTLSIQRAEAVKQYILANTKLKTGSVEAVGYGESQPIANNRIELGRAANRRVEVVIHP